MACSSLDGRLEHGERSRGDKRDPWAGIDLHGIFERLGWRVLEIDGHDYPKIIATLNEAKLAGESNQPTLIIAHTIKGKGVRLAEGKFAWHSKVATQEELTEIAAELGIEEPTA